MYFFVCWVVTMLGYYIHVFTYEPVRGKTNNLGSRPGPTHTGLYNHRRRLKA